MDYCAATFILSHCHSHNAILGLPAASNRDAIITDPHIDYSAFSTSADRILLFLSSVALGMTWLKSPTGRFNGKSTVVSISARRRYQPIGITANPKEPPAWKVVSC